MSTPTNCSYEPLLRESIAHFLASYRNGSSDFSAFESIFFRLLQTMPDPPLQITWFYSAVAFHTSKKSTLAKSLVAKDLLQLLISCSSFSRGSKKIALLAPVLYALYDVIREISNDGLASMGEIEVLVEKIVNYVSICCDDLEIGNECDDLVVCFEDLVDVWTVDWVGDADSSAVFFPFLNHGLSQRVNRTLSITSLAGVVMCQVFLLSLCLKFQFGSSQGKLQCDTLNWAVQTMKKFKNSYFLDLLLRVVLEPCLPVTTLLKLDSAILWKLVYDAVILVDYSFLNSGRWNQILDNHSKDLALVWTLVADVAINFARDMKDEAKAESYVTAFSGSQLPPLLIKWIADQICAEKNLNLPKFQTPKALIKWLLVIEDKGLLVFSDNELKTRARAAVCSPMLHGKANHDEEMVALLENSIGESKYNVLIGRKQKRELIDVSEKRLKHVKYTIYENSSGEKLLPFSDEDMEVMG